MRLTLTPFNSPPAYQVLNQHASYLPSLIYPTLFMHCWTYFNPCWFTVLWSYSGQILSWCLDLVCIRCVYIQTVFAEMNQTWSQMPVSLSYCNRGKKPPLSLWITISSQSDIYLSHQYGTHCIFTSPETIYWLAWVQGRSFARGLPLYHCCVRTLAVSFLGSKRWYILTRWCSPWAVSVHYIGCHTAPSRSRPSPWGLGGWVCVGYTDAWLCGNQPFC